MLGREIPVLFLEQAEPRIDVAIGHLEQAGGATGALMKDPVALRQREDVVLLPSDGGVADLAFAGTLDHAANGIGGGTEGKRRHRGIELHQEAVDQRHSGAAGERVYVTDAARAVARL